MKFDCHLGLDNFVKEYEALENMTYNGAQEKSKEIQNYKE